MPSPIQTKEKPKLDDPEREQLVTNLAQLIVQAHRLDQSSCASTERPSDKASS